VLRKAELTFSELCLGGGMRGWSGRGSRCEAGGLFNDIADASGSSGSPSKALTVSVCKCRYL